MNNNDDFSTTDEFLRLFEDAMILDEQAVFVFQTFPGLWPLYQILSERVEVATLGYAGTVISLKLLPGGGERALAAVALAFYKDDGRHWLLKTKIAPSFAAAKTELLSLETRVKTIVEKVGGGRSVFRRVEET
jgi:hypothetical protein